MKFFKKATALLIATACAAVPFALAACGGNDGDGSGNSEYSVSEAEWRAAFAEDQFKNVTITQKAPGKGSTSSNGVTVNYTHLETTIMKVDRINGKIMTSSFSEYEYDTEVDSDLFPTRRDYSDGLYIQSGDAVYEYQLEDDGWRYICDDGDMFFFYSETIMKSLPILAGMYDIFKYDEKTGNYVYESGANKMVVRLENKKLASTSQEVPNMPMAMTLEFKDYGTTVIDIPDDLPPVE